MSKPQSKYSGLVYKSTFSFVIKAPVHVGFIWPSATIIEQRLVLVEKSMDCHAEVLVMILFA